MEKLLKIQSELKAPKNQFNKFGGYNYRSQEDILEAVKPLLKKYGCTLTITDTIEECAGRVYVQAWVTFSDGDQDINVSAYAREAETKKGMDEAQITGSASSYARKYALNGLFLIDDTRDADATNEHNSEKPKKPAKNEGLEKGAVLRRLEMCKDVETLKAIWAETKDKDDENIVAAFKARREKIETQNV